MQNAAYPPQYNAGAQPVPMPEQVGYYAAPAMLGGPVPGRPSYVLPQAPSVGSWPLPPATTQMVPGMAPPPAPANEEPTKVVRAKGVARARWNRDEEERLKKLVDLGVPSCGGAFTSLDGLVSISRCRGWFLFDGNAPRRSGSTVPSGPGRRSPRSSGAAEPRRAWNSTGRS